MKVLGKESTVARWETWSLSVRHQQWHLSQSWTHLCFSGLSYCHGFGNSSLFTGNKLAVLPIASLGQGGGESWLFLLLRKLRLARGVWALQIPSSHPYLLPLVLALPHPSLGHMGVWRGSYGSQKGCRIPGSCRGHAVAKSLGANPNPMLPLSHP